MTLNACSALSIRNIDVSYGRVRALHSLTLDVAEGETFGLMGLNGAGKTTLIKSILGLRDVDSGEIHVFGQEHMTNESRRRYAYLPERFDPPWFLKGIEFIRFSQELYGVDFNDDAARSSACQLGLDPAALDRRVQTYSKGMRQKLGLMGTVLTGCGLLILDEPMSGLDPRARAAVKDMILKIKKQGKTVFLSSHILSDMDEICDRVGILHEGCLLYTGLTADLKDQSGMDNLEKAFLRRIA